MRWLEPVAVVVVNHGADHLRNVLVVARLLGMKGVSHLVKNLSAAFLVDDPAFQFFVNHSQALVIAITTNSAQCLRESSLAVDLLHDEEADTFNALVVVATH